MSNKQANLKFRMQNYGKVTERTKRNWEPPSTKSDNQKVNTNKQVDFETAVCPASNCKENQLRISKPWLLFLKSLDYRITKAEKGL